jgi:PAS domain S-box-containing protein
MKQDPQPIRIAIIVDREEASCLPLALPYSVVGYPLVQIEFFKAGAPPQPQPSLPPVAESPPEAVLLGLFQEQVGQPLRPLAELRPGAYDLVLDWQHWTAALAGVSPEELDNLVTGPGSPMLEKVLCQFQELRQKHEINAGVLISATDAIVTIDEDQRIIGYNYGAEKMFGYPREEALGQDLKIIIPPPHKEVHQEYVRRYVATREARVIGRHVQLTAQRRDGTEFPMSISFSVAEIQGRLYFTGIIRDITEYKEIEARLVHSERLAAIGNTVSHIAHEIKNPLLIIGGFARQLLKTPALDPKDQKKLTIIAEEVSRLEAMVGEMRDFVRLPPPQKSFGQLDLLLEEILLLFETAFKEQNIRVRRVDREPLPRLHFDPQQLHRVLMNLFKNALEAMPQGGELTIATRVENNQVEVSISDTGEGMPPEVRANIFQPYFTTKEKGTGLGLAICKNIVEEHGGCMLVDSQPGKGSTFTIQIPLEETPPA